MLELSVLVVCCATLANILTATNGFQQKTACFVDYIPSEDELEGEGPRWHTYDGQAGLMSGPNTWNGPNMGMNLGGPVDREDLMESMGYGEMDEMEDNNYMGRGLQHHFGARPTWEPRGQGFLMNPFDGGNGTLGMMTSSGGYMGADGEWEDYRRKRKRRRRKRQAFYQHSPLFLIGLLRCDTREKIHINNVTLGYSISPFCRQAMTGCRATSSKAKQVLHCQGKTNSCRVSIRRHLLSRCRQRVNFAQIDYECIPANRMVDICTNRSSDETQAVVISSDAYHKAMSSKTATVDNVVTCECTLRSAPPSVFEMAYLRANLPGKPPACHGDLLLLERPTPGQRDRFQIEAEICGLNNTSEVTVIEDNILRITFLGGAPVSDGVPGFLGKFQAKSPDGGPELFQVSCHSSLPQSDIDLETTSVSNDQNAFANQLREWLAKTGRTLPANFDLSSLPANFLNMTRDELMNYQSSGGQTQISGAILGRMLDSMAENSNSRERNSPGEGENAGVLSGVIAALVSVIVIMGSIGGLYFYTRRQQRIRRQMDEANERYDYMSASDFHHNIASTSNNNAPTDVSSRPPRGRGEEVSPAAIYSIASQVPFPQDTGRQRDSPNSPATMSDHGHTTPLPPPRRKKTTAQIEMEHYYSSSTSDCSDYIADSTTYDNANLPNVSDVTRAPHRLNRKSRETADLSSATQKVDENLGGSKDDDSYTSINDVTTEIALSAEACNTDN